MKNFIFLAFLACVLLSFVTISESLPSLEKRNNCHLYKRNVLGKRTNEKEKKCPCALADSDFEDGPVRGLVVYAQDECGATTITGQFSKGFEDTSKNFTFSVVDKCGCTIRDLTCDLKVQFTGDGGSKTFSKKVEDLNLNCDKHGLLLDGSSSPYNKRTCYSKRDLGDFTYYPNVNAYMRINSDGDGYAQAAISQI